jgi:hypothetical protein
VAKNTIDWRNEVASTTPVVRTLNNRGGTTGSLVVIHSQIPPARMSIPPTTISEMVFGAVQLVSLKLNPRSRATTPPARSARPIKSKRFTSARNEMG